MNIITINIIRGIGVLAFTFGLIFINNGLPSIGYSLMAFGLCWLTVELKE